MKIKVGDEEIEVISPQEMADMLAEKDKVHEENLQKVLDERLKKEEPKKIEEPVKKEPNKEEDIDAIVEKKMALKASSEAFDSFKKELGDIKDIDAEVFAGLNPKQYSAMKTLFNSKKTLSEEEFNKKVDELATEKAKKILIDSKDEKDKDKNTVDYKSFKKY